MGQFSKSSECPSLTFIVKEVIGMRLQDDKIFAIVKDESGEKQLVDPKSVALQNLDVSLTPIQLNFE